MRFKGCYSTLRRGPAFAPINKPLVAKPLKSVRGAKSGPLDIRQLSWSKGGRPVLLVSAGRRQGKAKDRNKFRRRVRMAFLAILREMPQHAASSFALWVRPSRVSPCGCRIGYQEIKNQIKLSLQSLRRPT